jgi:hypothetical protein
MAGQEAVAMTGYGIETSTDVRSFGGKPDIERTSQKGRL